MKLLASLMVCALVFQMAYAVDNKKFRDCGKTAFCRRNRNNNGQFVSQQYHLTTVSTDKDNALLTADLNNGKFPLQESLELTIAVTMYNTVRFSVREKNPLFPRFEVPDVLSDGSLIPNKGIEWSQTQNGATGKFSGNRELKVTFNPFSFTLLLNGHESMHVNSKNLMQFEAHRPKNPKPADGEVMSDSKFRYDEDGDWEEEFDKHTDSKPRGPASVALDVTFPGAQHVYGIPEHASDFSLKTTNGGEGQYDEPYRLWNLDVFEYDLDVPMALYGAVPFMIAHDTEKTSGFLWLNSAETYIDVADSANGKESHWISESGIIDAFFFTGTQPQDVWQQYAVLTGFPALPQSFAIAYHQCRWNYKTEEDVAEVDGGFDAHDIPYDVLWLDIEHTDGKKYFTWDSTAFPTPKEMQNKIAAKGRKMVTIIDPHIKRESGYQVHENADHQKLYVQNKDKDTYEGWCWPGSVSYLDFLRPEVRDYWAGLFAFDKYEGSTPALFTWNDMNEPSVFNGPEVTMPKDNLHMNGEVEHRDAHNIYGAYVQQATALGQEKRDNARSFVLTRSFFAGSQKYGAVWTGDNMAKWDHLQAATPMLLSLGVAGITFSGADVGGFFGDPTPELLVRWYQTGAYQPFFRGHAHIDTKRREPWLFGEPHTSNIRTAIQARYRILPYLYSTFFHASISGVPVMRPLWAEFPKEKAVFGIEDQFMLGSALLVAPVTHQGAETRDVVLPGETGVQTWFDLVNGRQFTAGSYTVKAPINKIPVFQRGGQILPMRWRSRRSSTQMVNDPLTLVVALSANGEATGQLYMDDGKSFEYRKGAYLFRALTFKDNVLTASGKDNRFQTPVVVERVVLYGAPAYTKATVVVDGDSRAATVSSTKHSVITVRKPDVKIMAKQWSIKFEL